MTAATTSPRPAVDSDTAGSAPIPLGRLVGVELRKLVDTRSGRWLLIAQAILITVAMAVRSIIVGVEGESISLWNYAWLAGSVMAFLLPVMGIMSITTEWSQRAAMTTFTLEPRRTRVVAAKLAAVVVTSIVAVAVAIVIGVAASAVAAAVGIDVTWSTDLHLLVSFAVAHVLGLLVGFAFGAMCLNTPGGLVGLLAYHSVVPALLEVGTQQFGWFARLRPSIDFGAVLVDLSENGFAAVQAGHVVTATALWVGVPLTIGVRRLLRAEIT